MQHGTAVLPPPTFPGVTQPHAPSVNPTAFPPVQDAGKDRGDQPPEGPRPREIPPFGPDQIRMPRLQPGQIVGGVPRPSKETLDRQQKFVGGIRHPELILDLVVGDTQLMVLKVAPKRVQIADDSIASYTLITPTQLSLLGRTTGSTVLTLWFADPKDPTKEEVLTYRVNVSPDATLKDRLEKVFKALSEEINCAFPDSFVCLQLVGDKVLVNGWAHDIVEAAKIMRIVRANYPDRKYPYPLAAKVPYDRARTGLPGEEFGPEGAQGPPGPENYILQGSPNVIDNLKIPGEQQVCLRVTVAEINRAAARSIGLNFSLLNNKGTAVFANNTGSIATGGITFSGGNGVGGALGVGTGVNNFGITPLAGIATGAGGFNNLPAALDNGQVRLAISALRELQYAKSLAEPNLVAMNGTPASFMAGGEFPVPVVTGFTSVGLQGVNFVPYGVQLTFTPYITDRDRVRLVMQATVSTRDLANGTTNIGGAAVPGLTSRSFSTTVEMREGQTLAVAGLIQNNMGADAHRVPFIGDVPILNNLLGFARITAAEQELVVLVTPELVHPMDPKEVPPLPGSDLFEPTDLEFYVLGRIESHRGVNFRSPVRTDWQRLCEYRRMEGMYMSGPVGNGGEQ
jgi:pilus assembly protein CpaC